MRGYGASHGSSVQWTQWIPPPPLPPEHPSPVESAIMTEPGLAVGGGRVHLVYVAKSPGSPVGDILYSRRNASGWSSPVRLSEMDPRCASFNLSYCRVTEPTIAFRQD